MSKKKKIIITIISFFFIFLFFNLIKDKEMIDLSNFNKPEEKEIIPEEIIPEYQSESVVLEYETFLLEDISQTNSELLIINLAKNFTERFGSWSTDNQGVNLEELLPLSTAKMKAHLNNIVLDYEVEEFFALFTKSLATEIIFLDEEEGDAKVLVKTQRIKTLSDLSTEVYYHDMELDIILSGDKWLVTEAQWQ